MTAGHTGAAAAGAYRQSATGNRPGYPTAAATAITANISTSTPAMIRFLVFGSIH
ncbi:hypothetical protein NLX86_28345 [Streptomyces sp. A3M-1-3]|uniref:hypothetical protein n=1 Tax=Streptomyces sp. A3M-1-3 TaxID=2962044 RepID=UPI0020B662A6|nr:hypothetical protein [Streptomyces sp. A3M-1-3]MCP3821862.1 hypothetical protein [Streptomyces sp. A3M-1-3]